jgi:predicted ATPase
LNPRRLLITLPLGTLEAEEGRALAERLLDGDTAPDVTSLLYERSEGSPIFLEELLRTHLDENILIWKEGRWELQSHPRKLLPPHITAVIRLRLAWLDPAVIDLLRVAAVIGRAFDLPLLAQVTQSDVEQIEEALLTAARAQIVRLDAEEAYAFAHDMVRETTCAEVGRVRRKRLHQQIGEALEAEGETGAPRGLADLTFHFAEAGDTARGVAYALGPIFGGIAAVWLYRVLARQPRSKPKPL